MYASMDHQHSDQSDMSLRSFLSKARQHLTNSLQTKSSSTTSFVIGNTSADLDSVACSLIYGYLQSSTKANRLIIPITNIPASELRLRTELTALLKHADLKPSDLLTLDDVKDIHNKIPPTRTDWILVDHNSLLGSLGEHFSSRVNGVIDHHEDDDKVPKDAAPRIIEKSGSCSSLVVNYCREAWEAGCREKGQGEVATTDAQVAKLALGAILIDTINLEAEYKVTDHDKRAVEYLEGKLGASEDIGKKYNRGDFFKEINDAKSNVDSLTVMEILEKDYKEWAEGDLKLGISSCVRSVQYLVDRKEDLEDVILRFAKDQELDLFALMTAHNDRGEFARELLLVAIKDSKAMEVTERFASESSKELELEASNIKIKGEEMKWLQLWEQKNLSASRKQVAPLLRKKMR